MTYKKICSTILCLLMAIASFSQSTDLLSRVLDKDPSLSIYSPQDPNRYMIAAALDHRTHVLYFITCYGQLADSMRMTDADYQQVQQKRVSPFAYYNAVCDRMLSITQNAIALLRKKDQLPPKWVHTRFLEALLPELRTSANPLQKMVYLENLGQGWLLNKWLLNNDNPAGFPEDSARLYLGDDLQPAGALLAQGDYIIYYNRNNFAKGYKAILCSSTAVLYYTDRNNQVLDSLALNPGMVTAIVTTKTDVFLLYRGWLELQYRATGQSIRYLDSLNRNNDKGLLLFAGGKAYKIEQVVAAQKRSLAQTNERIQYTSIPDAKAIASLLHRDLRNAETSKALFAALGLGYTTSLMRGQKRYCLVLK